MNLSRTGATRELFARPSTYSTSGRANPLATHMQKRGRLCPATEPKRRYSMNYVDADPKDLRQKFWRAFADSPFAMLQLDNDPDSAAPMTAQLDIDADHAIWFFTDRNNRFARMGPTTVTFSSKGHDLFARFHGVLSEETSRERLDKQWSKFVEAWFPGGKNDPNLLMLRMDLGDASIWAAELGVIGTAKMALGIDVSDEVGGQQVATTL
jgi:general stress protein 26